MSNKKNLLNETQIRQFMKLASLQPLTPGFVEGLSEDKPFTAKKEKPGEDLRKGAEVRGAEGTKGKEGEGDAFVDVKQEGKDEELEEAVEEVVEDLGASKLKDIGRCMSALKQRYPGKIESGTAGKVMRKALTSNKASAK